MASKGGKKEAASRAPGKKKSTGAKGGKRNVQEQGIPMANEIRLIVSFGIMVILTLSNFGWCGTVGIWMSSFFFGMFGCVQYAMPLAFFLMATVLIANDYSVLAIKKCGAAFVLLTMISSLAQLMVRSKVTAFYDLFAQAAKDHNSGGMLGGGIALWLKSWFGMPGAFVIIGCVMLLSLVMLTQKSFVGFFRNFLEKTKRSWKTYREEYGKQKKERPSLAQKLREKQCEQKLKAMEEKREQTEQKRKAGNAGKVKTGEARQKPEIKIHIPLFTDEGEVKKRDEVQELRPQPYPLTEEDMKTKKFDGKLVFSFHKDEPVEKESVLPESIAASAEYEKPKAFPEETKELFPEEEDKLEDISMDIREEPESVSHLPEEMILSEEPVSSEKTNLPEEIVLSEDIAMSEAVAEPETAEQPDDTEEILMPEETVEEAEPEICELPEKTPDSAGEAKDAKEEIVVLEGDDDADGMDGWHAMQDDKKSPSDIKPKAYEDAAESESYVFPPVNLLKKGHNSLPADYDKQLKQTAMKLQSTLESFGVHVTITDISCGPAVTRYEMFPEQGTKVSKIISLTDDIKLNLAAPDIRIEAPIPGKAAIGIEIPNKENQTVHFRELVDNRVFRNFKSRLAFAVGKDIAGKIVVADLAKMPHLLIAGATGSGKSVCINTLIMSLLYKASPTEVKLIMIDPKMVELSIYNGIPHLLIPVVTDPKKASGALNWAVAEMTERYKKFGECSVRNLEGYNKKIDKLEAAGEIAEGKLEKMPQIVIIIDELADLMMVAPGEVEEAIVRLSQLARAAGIHLVIATQRPSVNVITGLIKANVPSRIAFSVSSGVDSRTIIDMNGAEKLLGKGDMLFYPSGYQKPVRVQGAFVSDEEVSRVVEFLKENETIAVYDEDVSQKIENKIKSTASANGRDDYFEAAARFIMEKDKATIGMLQRMFKVGFNRAARIIDQLAEAGIVGPGEGTKPRKILMSPEQLDQYFEENL